MVDQPPAPKPEHIDALVASVLALHGDRLDAEAAARVREHVERLRQAALALDAYHLDNGDEPDLSFRVVDRLDKA
jgi:hypothetical protein